MRTDGRKAGDEGLQGAVKRMAGEVKDNRNAEGGDRRTKSEEKRREEAPPFIRLLRLWAWSSLAVGSYNE